MASPVPACAKRPPNYVKGVEKPFTPYTGNNSNTPLPSNDVVTAIYKSPLHISIIPLHTRRRPRISHRVQAGRVKRRVCEVFRTSVASISPAVGRFHCAAGAQSFRFTRGAGRVFHNKCERSDTRCYFIRRSRISLRRRRYPGAIIAPKAQKSVLLLSTGRGVLFITGVFV